MLLVVIFAIWGSCFASVRLAGDGYVQQGNVVTVVPGSPPSSDTTPSGISKDIVSNVFKAIQITTQENLFLANLFTAASNISTLSLEATSVAINVRVLGAYMDLVTKSLELLEKHQNVGTQYGSLIKQVLEDAGTIMTTSLTP